MINWIKRLFYNLHDKNEDARIKLHREQDDLEMTHIEKIIKQEVEKGKHAAYLGVKGSKDCKFPNEPIR